MIETNEVIAGGHRFTVDTAGAEDGEPVILLHGFPNSRHSWTEVLGELAEQGYRAHAPDQRGYSLGARPSAVEDYHVDHIVSDVIALADAVGAGRFHLVGHDWGGQVAWLTASRHAQRLKSLTVLSRPHPAAFAQALRTDPAQANRSRHHRAFQDSEMATRLLADDAKAIRNTLCYENAAGLFGRDASDAGPPLKRRMSDEMAARHLLVLGTEAAMNAALNWYRSAFSGGSTLARDDIPSITVPTLYLWGREDMSVGEVAASATPQYVSAPRRFEAIDGAGHFLAEEVPQTVAALLLAHLGANRDWPCAGTGADAGQTAAR